MSVALVWGREADLMSWEQAYNVYLDLARAIWRRWPVVPDSPRIGSRLCDVRAHASSNRRQTYLLHLTVRDCVR